MVLDQNERQKQAAHLREQYRDKIPSGELDAFVNKLCACHIIKPQPQWAIHEDDIRMRASIVEKWEIVNVIDIDEPVSFLFSDMLIWDYKHRGKRGDYVFTSPIENFDIERGLVQTRNSLYCLSGEGEELNATLLEICKMSAIKQPLHFVRAIERDIGRIMGSEE